jgi:hypothetical protein
MGQQSVATILAPEVTIEEVHGSLQIRGWERPEVLIRYGSEDDVILESSENGIQIRCNSDCLIRLPHGAYVSIGNVHGSTRIKLLDERLSCQQVDGSLVLGNVGETIIEAVHGDLLAKQVMGPLTAKQVNGNAVARDVQGDLTIEQVSGNLDLRDIEGNIATYATGNARVRLNLLASESYTIKASGNLHCRIPDYASVQLDLSSGTNEIRIKTPESKDIFRETNHRTTLGDGEATMTLSAGGSLSLTCQETDWSNMDEVEAEFERAFAGFSETFEQQISAQIEAQVESQLEVLNEQMETLAASLQESGLSDVEIERTMRKARQSSERASAHAEEKMRRAQEKLERKLAAAQRKAELKAKAAERRRRGWRYEGVSSDFAARDEPVSDDERLIILRMLEEKKISLEEAENLLASLESN